MKNTVRLASVIVLFGLIITLACIPPCSAFCDPQLSNILDNGSFPSLRLATEHDELGSNANMSADVATEGKRELFTCDKDGNRKDEFNPGEDVYVRGTGFEPGATYDLYICGKPVGEGDTLDRKQGLNVGSFGRDDGTIDFYYKVWTIPQFAIITDRSYLHFDVVADRDNDGNNTGVYNVSSDGICHASIRETSADWAFVALMAALLLLGTAVCILVFKKVGGPHGALYGIMDRRSSDEFWRDFSEEIGGLFKPGGYLRNAKVEFQHRAWTITLCTHREAGDNYTQICTPYPENDGFHFTILRNSMLRRTPKIHGSEQVEVGHPLSLDGGFAVWSNDEKRITDLVSDHEVADMISRQTTGYFRLSLEGSGPFGKSLPGVSDELCLQTQETRDPGKVKQLLSVMTRVLDHLAPVT